MIDPSNAPRFSREDLETIDPPDTCPADFDQFWAATIADVESTVATLDVRRIWSPAPEVEVFVVYYRSVDNTRIGAWITRPNESRGGVVVGHGYGGRCEFELEHALRGYTAIMPCIRGFHLSSHESIPSTAASHVLHRIESRDNYVLRGCVADLSAAADVLIELYPDVADGLCFSGTSFCGGLGAFALGFDRRFRAGHLEVPTFGHHPRRLQTPCTGSGEAVRLYAAQHPQVVGTLAYFDAATAASRIAVPVLCAPALYDPAVTPPGQWAVANAIPDKELFVLPAGHFDYPDATAVSQRLRNRLFDFFDQAVGR